VLSLFWPTLTANPSATSFWIAVSCCTVVSSLNTTFVARAWRPFWLSA
jgi:hypothetical protein